MSGRYAHFLEAGRLQPGEDPEEHKAAVAAVRAQLAREAIRPAGIPDEELEEGDQ